jgi:hypothetical protein
MAIKLTVMCAGRPLPPGKFFVLIFVSGSVDPKAIVQLEGLGKLKNPVPSSAIESMTFKPLE